MRLKHIDLVTLRLFVSIADTGRLTAAAEREHIALAAVSKRISELEAHLATPLLYRRPRGVHLTPAGDALLHHARNMLDSMERLTADLSEYSAGVRGHVRIAANTSAIIEFLPADLATFSSLYPEVKIDLQECLSTEAIHAVREGLTDIGIFAAFTPAEDMTTYTYRRDQLVLVTAADHPLAARQSIRLAEAAAYDFIGLQQDTSLHALITNAAKQAHKCLRVRIQVRSFEGICRMIAQNMGVGVLPELAVASHLRSLALATVALDEDWAYRDLVLGVRDPDSLSVLARQMVQHLTGYPQEATKV